MTSNLAEKFNQSEGPPASQTMSGKEVIRIMENKEVSGWFAEPKDIDQIFNSHSKINTLKPVVNREKFATDKLDKFSVKSDENVLAKGNKAKEIMSNTKIEIAEAEDKRISEIKGQEMKYQKLRDFLNRLVGAYAMLGGDKKYKLYKLAPESKNVVDTYAKSEITGSEQKINMVGDGCPDSALGDDLFVIDSNSVAELKQHLTDAKLQRANCRLGNLMAG